MKSLKIVPLIVVASLLMSTVQAQTSAAHRADSGPIHVLLLDGQSGGPYHNWKLTTPILREELEETGLFQITVLTAPTSDGDFSGFDPKFSHYQVIVSNYDAPDWPEALRLRFEQYISDGGGFVVV